MANAVGELFLNLQVSFHWPINFPHDYNLIQREIYRNLLETFEYRHFLLDWEGGGVIFNVLKKFFDFIQFSLIVIFSHPFLWLDSWAEKIWIWTLSLETSGGVNWVKSNQALFLVMLKWNLFMPYRNVRKAGSQLW